MSINLNPYLNFHGNAREALEFYHSILGGELDLRRYDSIPGMMGSDDDPAESAKIMHGQLDTPDGLTIMAADYPSSMAGLPDATSGGSTVCVWGGGDNIGRMEAVWDSLTEGAQIRQPLAKAPWGGKFGMLSDRYGVPWMFNIDG